MRKYLLFVFVVLVGLFISSCEDSGTDPIDNEEPKAVITLSSTPSAAQIWLTYPGTTTAQNKGNTPDSVVNLEQGTYTITLKLDGYRDTSWVVTLTAGQRYNRSVTLTSSLVVTTLGPVRIYETTGTTAQQPSGLDLSTGQAVSSSNAAADLIYETNSTFTIHRLRFAGSKNTLFRDGNATNLSDGVDSPTQDNTWATEMSDEATNYYFIFDNDQHYSKFKIVNISSLTESPAWVEVEWIYNGTSNDKRF